MARQNSAAGILLYREVRGGGVEVLLVHPGGPFWAKKDDAAWSIPKGLTDEGEPLLAAARREFAEETGMVPEGEFIDLGEFRQASGKRISAFALRGDFDPAQLKSNLFSLEWPPKSGKLVEFPEVDRAAWFDVATALRKATKGQVADHSCPARPARPAGPRAAQDRSLRLAGRRGLPFGGRTAGQSLSGGLSISDRGGSHARHPVRHLGRRRSL